MPDLQGLFIVRESSYALPGLGVTGDTGPRTRVLGYIMPPLPGLIDTSHLRMKRPCLTYFVSLFPLHPLCSSVFLRALCGSIFSYLQHQRGSMLPEYHEKFDIT